MILEVPNKHHCKLDKLAEISRNFEFNHNLCFLSINQQLYIPFESVSQNKGFFCLSNYCTRFSLHELFQNSLESTPLWIKCRFLQHSWDFAERFRPSIFLRSIESKWRILQILPKAIIKAQYAILFF